MAESTKEYISTLNSLIETCRDGEQGFRDAAQHCERQDLRSTLHEYSTQRRQFASELQSLVSRIGGEPEHGGSVGASVHRGWINLKSALTGRDDHAVLAECERGEDSAVHSYQDALAHDLPSDIRSAVEEQYRQILEAHNRVRALRDGAAMDNGSEHRSHGVGTEVRTDVNRAQDEIASGVRAVRDDATGRKDY